MFNITSTLPADDKVMTPEYLSAVFSDYLSASCTDLLSDSSESASESQQDFSIGCTPNISYLCVSLFLFVSTLWNNALKSDTTKNPFFNHDTYYLYDSHGIDPTPVDIFFTGISVFLTSVVLEESYSFLFLFITVPKCFSAETLESNLIIGFSSRPSFLLSVSTKHYLSLDLFLLVENMSVLNCIFHVHFYAYFPQNEHIDKMMAGVQYWRR